MDKMKRGRHARPQNRQPRNQRPPRNQRRQPPPPQRYGGRIVRRRRGCYIATACYGSYYAPQVVVLRRFRDEFLANSLFGRGLIKFYYLFSPFLAENLKHFNKLNNFVKRNFLEKLVIRLKKKFDF